MPHTAYAFKCARADASRGNAILCLRVMVEDQGVPLSKALGAIMGAFPLGLREIADITDEAQRRYKEAL